MFEETGTKLMCGFHCVGGRSPFHPTRRKEERMGSDTSYLMVKSCFFLPGIDFLRKEGKIICANEGRNRV
jgi:hypothetical protein